jgi:hypothetical protein
MQLHEVVVIQSRILKIEPLLRLLDHNVLHLCTEAATKYLRRPFKQPKMATTPKLSAVKYWCHKIQWPDILNGQKTPPN